MTTFTVFCSEPDGTGSMWIKAVDADSVPEAIAKGQAECAEDWDRDDIEEVLVRGVVEGDVKVLTWEDPS